MFSQRTLVPGWIFLILLVNLVQGFTNAKKEINSTSENGNGTIIPSQIVESLVANGTNHTEALPNYVLRYEAGHPCLLASLNITIHVSYYVRAQKSKRKYIAFQDVPVPEDVDISSSVCGENQSSLIMEWDNSTFNLNLTFNSHGSSGNGVHTNWTLDSVAFGYNLSNLMTFPGTSQDKYVLVDKSGLGLFNTLIDSTKECDSQIKVTLGSKEMGPVIKFDYVKLAAFNLTSELFPKETHKCIIKTSSLRDEDMMVPLIIACALSFVIIVVVVAYAISRKVQEARDQSQYKPMP